MLWCEIHKQKAELCTDKTQKHIFTGIKEPTQKRDIEKVQELLTKKTEKPLYQHLKFKD